MNLKVRVPDKISPREAVSLQKQLSSLVKEKSELPSRIRSLIGCDAAYASGTAFAAAVQVDHENFSLLKISTVTEPIRFPYIPGLLAFREAPSLLRAIRGLHGREYVCLVDAHGVAHPRRFGLACFVGLALDRPTVGVAKSLLYGREKGDDVVDQEGHALARIVTTPAGKTIYVSVGHKISLEDAVKVVRRSMASAGPIPIQLAHREVTNCKWQFKRSSQVS